LVLVGAYDYTTPLSAGLLQAALPNARLVLFPNSAHSAFLDEPEAYFGALTGFLRGL
jgi:pimeloyl-ACP methyl ester carboxylesterase